ncbi:hypothetical protein PENSUB_8058 [Penicillium subrubescens]|uniref:Cis-aconitate decarboxylase n=1 Tax=Penicillium subrubescens TaxID=1316194 RepID=A0A1Q5THZ0_9EURO|nr:hypothetical protein PENSUB_8058 [Penicillium subrubescens]
MATQTLATWSTTLTYSTLPPSVIHAAIRSFYNWTGCTVGGSTHPASKIALKALSRFSGPPTSRLLGSDGSVDVDAMHAALLNGIASHVHDYDDTHLDTVIHPTGPVASALLAVVQSLEREVSGEEFITALVVGVEGECKSNKFGTRHITSTTGSIGAALAVSKILNLTPHQTAHAIGLAATQVTGLREMFGSHTKSFHPGRAAQNGLLAAVLAAEDLTSSTTALEAKRGWANVVSNQHRHRLDEQIATLGDGEKGRWEIVRNAFKPFPCGIVVHPVIDGCIQIHDELFREGIDIERVVSVVVQVHPLVVELTGKTAPRDGLEGKFSVYHGGAVGLLFGKATPAQYEDDVVRDLRVVAVREKIQVEVDGGIEADECRIEVRLDNVDGDVKTVHVEHAVGSLERPMTDAQLTEKFLEHCLPVLGRERTEKASQWCWGLEKVVDVRCIKDVL